MSASFGPLGHTTKGLSWGTGTGARRDSASPLALRVDQGAEDVINDLRDWCQEDGGPLALGVVRDGVVCSVWACCSYVVHEKRCEFCHHAIIYSRSHPEVHEIVRKVV